MHFRSRKTSRSSSTTATSSATANSVSNKPAMEKENASVMNCQNPSLIPHSSSSSSSSAPPAQPLSPRLFRCHSDTSQRNICSNVNPNTISTTVNLHRHGALSNNEKISKLQELNTTLVKEVSNLRSSQTTMESSIEALRIQLQASSYTTESLRAENNELEEEVESIRSELKKKSASFIASEDRLQAMVEDLRNTNSMLAEEASRLRQEAETISTEKKTLIADMDSLLKEKASLEDLVESFRLGEMALRSEMAKDIALADQQRKKAEEEKLQLLKLNTKLLEDKKTFEKEALTLREKLLESETQKTAIAAEKQKLSDDISKLRFDKMTMEDVFKSEKEKMLSEKVTVDSTLKILRVDHEKTMELLNAERSSTKQAKDEALELRGQNENLRDREESLKKEIHGLKGKIKNLQNALLHAEMVSSECECQKEMEMEKVSSLNKDLSSARVINEELRSRSVSLHMELSIARSESQHLQEELKALHELSTELETQKKKNQNRIREMESDIKMLTSSTESLQSMAEATEREFRVAKEEFTRVEDELNEKLLVLMDELKTSKSVAASKLEKAFMEVAEKDAKVKEAESQICTLRGELLIAEEEEKKVKQDSKAVVDKQLQKISILESKLAAMAEKETAMEAALVAKEGALKKASQGLDMIASLQKELSVCLSVEQKPLMAKNDSSNLANTKNKKKNKKRRNAKTVQVKFSGMQH